MLNSDCVTVDEDEAILAEARAGWARRHPEESARKAAREAERAAQAEADRLKTPEQRRQEVAGKRAEATAALANGIAACIALGMPADCPDPLGWIWGHEEAAYQAKEMMLEADHFDDEAAAWEAWAAEVA
ncbi:hypothetical protein [Sandaracinobacteroides hominis]|uniref:hypothetical protein n=1 Tax=Sandaracinobacteroides hominis TaxID=2780086 RepID=UPI0018F363A0|nr:hypothetical protein [Sandaracinobacteroides hominis]